MKDPEQLASEFAKLPADSPERAARLQQLRELVQAGEYEVDSSELARILIDQSIIPPRP